MVTKVLDKICPDLQWIENTDTFIKKGYLKAASSEVQPVETTRVGSTMTLFLASIFFPMLSLR